MRKVLSWLDGLMRKPFTRFISVPGDQASASQLYALFRLALVFIVLVFAVNILFNREGYGPWGDFLGGVLNPILSFMTFMGLLITIVLQQTELREARREFSRSANALENQNVTSRRQNFEATLFGMLSMHSSILKGVEAFSPAQGTVLRGHSAFRPMYTYLSDNYRSAKATHQHDLQDIDIARLAYKRFWNEYQPTISHYVRFIYNVFRFTKENSPMLVEHVRLVRSQISDYELLYLYYNCISLKGQRFKKLAEELALFDNLPEHFLDPSHKQFVAPSAFGRQGPPTRAAAETFTAEYYENIGRRTPPKASRRNRAALKGASPVQAPSAGNRA